MFRREVDDFLRKTHFRVYIWICRMFRGRLSVFLSRFSIYFSVDWVDANHFRLQIKKFPHRNRFNDCFDFIVDNEDESDDINANDDDDSELKCQCENDEIADRLGPSSNLL